MKKVLITGANSYIGTSFEDYVRKNYQSSVNSMRFIWIITWQLSTTRSVRTAVSVPPSARRR